MVQETEKGRARVRLAVVCHTPSDAIKDRVRNLHVGFLNPEFWVLGGVCVLVF